MGGGGGRGIKVGVRMEGGGGRGIKVEVRRMGREVEEG